MEHGSPATVPQTTTGLWFVRHRTAWWVVGKQSFICIHSCSSSSLITSWALPPVRSAATFCSLRSVNPTVTCRFEESRLCTSYENHPKTIPWLQSGKIAFHKTGPWCQKVWGPLWWRGLVASRSQCMVTLNFKAGNFLPELSKVYQDSSFHVSLPSLAFPSDTVTLAPCRLWAHLTCASRWALHLQRAHSQYLTYTLSLSWILTPSVSSPGSTRSYFPFLGHLLGPFRSPWGPSLPVALSLAASCPPFAIGPLCISLVNHGLPCTWSYLTSAHFFSL